MDQNNNGVFAAMVAVQKLAAAEGIAKLRTNRHFGFNFRGVDDVMNALAGWVSANGLFVLPAYDAPVVAERRKATKNGERVYYNVAVRGTFHFVHADGSRVSLGPVLGEANDDEDKATSKAMSHCYKNAMFQAFVIPLEGLNGRDHDADGEPEVEYVSDDQVAQLRAALSEAGRAEKKFVEWMKLERLEDMRANHFSRALEKIRAVQP